MERRQGYKKVAHLVCAEAQSALVRQLLDGAVLNDIERDWVRRGRNSVKSIPARIPPATYKEATGLEVLLGFLHMTDRDRLEKVLESAFELSPSLPGTRELLKGRRRKKNSPRLRTRDKDIDADLRKELMKKK